VSCRRPPRLLAIVAVVGALLTLPPRVSWAQSPLVDQVRDVASTYHEDPSRLDRVRQALEQAVKTDSHVENLLALAHVSFMWGDVRARNPREKLAAYEEGREAGRRAVELAPRSILAHFWYAANTARWGQVNGVLRSLFLLPTVRKEIETMVRLDPRFPPLYALAGGVDYEVPAFLGGSLERAEQWYRKGLELDPRFTALRIGLARVLLKRGQTADAQRELRAVLEEKEPTLRADWTMKDVRVARTMLGTIEEERRRAE
jgi:tetratricopeptide (TPR) repeat protein